MRLIFVGCGHLSLALGVVGAFLPLLPTTPFILLAAYFYSRGSERFHRWLYEHPRFGRMLLDWNKHGVIRFRAKVISAVAILVSLSYPLVFLDLHWGIKLAAGFAGMCSLSFILSRPSVPRQRAKTHSTQDVLKQQKVA